MEETSSSVIVPLSEAELTLVATGHLVTHGKPSYEVIDILKSHGANVQDATRIVNYVAEALAKDKKNQAQKDMLWGGLWMVGGLVGTFANTGFIFWGAIIFGGIQFFKGVANYNN
jgi:hypothetical protein